MARQLKKVAQNGQDADALFLGTGVRSIARKTLLPGYTIVDLERFIELLYGMFDEKEAKRITVFDPFAQKQARCVTVARLAQALEDLVSAHKQTRAS